MIISGRQISTEIHDDIPIVRVMSDSVQLTHAAKERPSEHSATALTTQLSGDGGEHLGNQPHTLAKGEHADSRVIPINKTLDSFPTVNNRLDTRDQPDSVYGNIYGSQFQAANPGSLYVTDHAWTQCMCVLSVTNLYQRRLGQ